MCKCQKITGGIVVGGYHLSTSSGVKISVIEGDDGKSKSILIRADTQ